MVVIRLVVVICSEAPSLWVSGSCSPGTGELRSILNLYNEANRADAPAALQLAWRRGAVPYGLPRALRHGPACGLRRSRTAECLAHSARALRHEPGCGL